MYTYLTNSKLSIPKKVKYFANHQVSYKLPEIAQNRLKTISVTNLADCPVLKY